jgi:hypothetical protein
LQRVRIALYIILGLALASLQPEWAENVAASAAAVVLECLPYLAASALAATLLHGRAPTLLAYLGCGCEGGPSARSIPAAIATALLFGPLLALARLVIAALIARRFAHPAHEHGTTLADALVSLAPIALLAASAAAIASSLGIASQPIIVQLIFGLVLGACASPCALGGIALASSLHTASPFASYAVLATAGFIDIRRWLPRSTTAGHDALAYTLVAGSAAMAVYHGGAQLVNPRLTPALFACVPYFAILAFRARGRKNAAARVTAAALSAAVVIGAPTPTYRATETTLSDTFAGESIEFTGRYVRTGSNAFVERYAITCCRADAAPIALELAQPLGARDTTWTTVVGSIATIDGRNVLRVRSYRAIPPPPDPFIYR